jgi:hypothetical protein
MLDTVVGPNNTNFLPSRNSFQQVKADCKCNMLNETSVPEDRKKGAGSCINLYFITIMKYLRKAAHKEKEVYLAHSF